MIIRCSTCGQYYETCQAETHNTLFRCPGKHFSMFTISTGIKVDAVKIEDNPFIRFQKELSKYDLVESEIAWIREQEVKLYDCGFLASHNVNIIPTLPLDQIQKPSEAGILRDSVNNVYSLVVSPNGIPYYKKESEDNER